MYQWRYLHSQSTGSLFMVVFSCTSRLQGSSQALQHDVKGRCRSARPKVFHRLRRSTRHISAGRGMYWYQKTPTAPSGKGLGSGDPSARAKHRCGDTDPLGKEVGEWEGGI